MAFFKIDVELEWLGLAFICAFAIYIIYRKANRLPDPPKLSSDQEETCQEDLVLDKCEEIADYFQCFDEKLDVAFEKLLETDEDDIQSLSDLRDYCEKMFSYLVDSDSKYDVIKFVGDFAADFKNSRLFNLISDKNVEIGWHKCKLLVSIEELRKVCENISYTFTAISDDSSTLCQDEQVKIFSKLGEASTRLNDSHVAPYFKAEKFKIGEVDEYLKVCIEQLSDEK